MYTGRGRISGVALGAEVPPPNFYYEQGRKLLEAEVSTVLLQM